MRVHFLGPSAPQASAPVSLLARRALFNEERSTNQSCNALRRRDAFIHVLNHGGGVWRRCVGETTDRRAGVSTRRGLAPMAATDIYIQAPPMLTAEEAALVLRIGRSKTYELARLFMATNGADGIPCLRIGHHLRFPRHQLEQLIGGPIPWPLVATLDTTAIDNTTDDTTEPTTTSMSSTPHTTRTTVTRRPRRTPSDRSNTPHLFSV